MRSAPSVSYPVGRSRFSALLRATLWVAGAAATGMWLATARVDVAGAIAAVGVLAGCAGWAAWSWFREPSGELSWDGARWTFTSGGRQESGDLQAALDLQAVLLVHLCAAGSRRWLWLERGPEPRRWVALRRAVHSPAFADAGAEPPGATS
jgi:hypothetical protein